jgi:hypothetical protein
MSPRQRRMVSMSMGRRRGLWAGPNCRNCESARRRRTLAGTDNREGNDDASSKFCRKLQIDEARVVTRVVATQVRPPLS